VPNLGLDGVIHDQQLFSLLRERETGATKTIQQLPKRVAPTSVRRLGPKQLEQARSPYALTRADAQEESEREEHLGFGSDAVPFDEHLRRPKRTHMNHRALLLGGYRRD